ncbi:hypothetical protein Q8F55_008313 [Vanrija albida]|uniref:Uncharacterized protein n=1 Tax=Vanrija albida TaxID=181172 RepID=A0ABR3PW81_9TREE
MPSPQSSPGPQHPHIKPALAPARVHAQVVAALNSTRALAERGYARAIISTYVAAKAERGRSAAQLNAKLLLLEREFAAVRKEFGLRESAVLSVPVEWCAAGSGESSLEPAPAYPGDGR